MTFQASRLIKLPRIHRRLVERIFFPRPMALNVIPRARNQTELRLGPAVLHLRVRRDVPRAAELRGAILPAMTSRASVIQQRMGRRRADERVQLRVRPPRVERVLRSVGNSLELLDPRLGLLAFVLRDLERVELLLQLLREPRRFFFRLESGTIDRP